MRSVGFAVVCVAASLLVSCHPVEAWYKQSTGPSYYSVGRASGLLSGIRRSPYARRSESDETLMDSGETPGNNVIPESSKQISLLKSMVSTFNRQFSQGFLFSTSLAKNKKGRRAYKIAFLSAPRDPRVGLK